MNWNDDTSGKKSADRRRRLDMQTFANRPSTRSRVTTAPHRPPDKSRGSVGKRADRWSRRSRNRARETPLSPRLGRVRGLPSRGRHRDSHPEWSPVPDEPIRHVQRNRRGRRGIGLRGARADVPRISSFGIGTAPQFYFDECGSRRQRRSRTYLLRKASTRPQLTSQTTAVLRALASGRIANRAYAEVVLRSG